MAYDGGRRFDTLRQVQDVLFEAAVVIKVRKKDLLKRPDDEEALHQYRISLRVARSMAKFLAPYQARGQNRRLKALLKQLQDPTSRMRELDVLVPELADHPDLQSLCAQAQRDTREAFDAQFRLPETMGALTEVEQMLRNVRWKKSVRDDGIDPDELAGRILARREACERMLEMVDFDDKEAVHDLRKRAKALRYVARDLAVCLPAGTGGVSSRMRKVQDQLGEWCDAKVNAALVDEICGEAGAAVAEGFRERAQGIMHELEQTRTGV